MSSAARIGLVVATVAVIVVAFVVLSPGGEDAKTAKTTTTVSGTITETPSAPAAPPSAYTTILVKGGKPVGGVKTITVKKGERVRIRVSSPDTTDEIHLHGYDLKRDLKAGGNVSFSFDGDAEGIFEVELEGSGVQIGKLFVEP